MKKLHFGELELSILQIVREKKTASVQEVYTAFGKKGSYNTIMTVMSRMTKKGQLLREKQGKKYIYSIPPGTCKSTSILRRVRDKIFQGKASSLIRYLLQTEEIIEEEELEEIAKLLAEKRGKKIAG